MLTPAPKMALFGRIPRAGGVNKNEQERKKNKELVRNFLEDYEEDTHRRRLHIKQARRLAAEEDAARMARPTKH